MASPAVSTPSSAASPAAISIAPAPSSIASRPSISAAPLVRMASLAPNGPMPTGNVGGPIGPTKQWVLPPRPKPGRKPATDTPPTKRKAQNRAAQRAFRERRAARVGELEEQLKETEEQRLKREEEMRDQIDEQSLEIERLEREVKKFSDDTKSWAARYSELQRVLAWEKQEKEAVMVEMSYLRNGARSTGTEAVPLPPRRHQHKPAPVTMPIYAPSPDAAHASATPEESMACGTCTDGSNCACVDAVMDMSIAQCGRCSPDHCECLEESLTNIANKSEAKRPRSPSGLQPSSKRVRQSIEVGPLEMDFTTRPKLSLPPQRQVQPPLRLSQDIASILNTPLRSAIDSCGFCKGGTFCLCEAAAEAEAAEAEAARNTSSMQDFRSRPSINEVTPPPSDTDVTFSDQYKLPPFQPAPASRFATATQGYAPMQPPTQASGGCSGNPGSCQQCQEDPKSGLFCRSLAAMRTSGTPSSNAGEGCCGGSSSGGGCCKNPPPAAKPPTQAEVALSCADAYKTLKSHRGFEQATNELGTWLPKLEMVERAGEGRYPGRPAYEVRAASVMSVLKDFDVRFGKETGRR